MDLSLGTSGSEVSGGAGGAILDSSTAGFQADVIDASQKMPVLVDFWAPWCGPCRQLTPALEKAVKGQAGKVRLVKINVDENQALAGQLGVQSIPAVFAFLGGRPVDGFMGAISEAEIGRFIQRLVDAAARGGLGGADEGSDRIGAAIEAAEASRAAGDTPRAAQIYEMLFEHAPDNPKVLLGLARLRHETGDLEAARAALALIPDDARSMEGFEALRTALELAEEAGNLDDAGALEARLASDPDDHEARFDLALVLNARGDKVEAAGHLVEIARRDREWNEDGARKKLLELFEAWGPKDPATLRGRRMLSALLFR